MKMDIHVTEEGEGERERERKREERWGKKEGSEAFLVRIHT